MNDDFTELENELRGFRLPAPSERLEERLGMLLERPPLHIMKSWWQKLGFNRPWAAFGWGILSPVLTAAVLMVVVRVVSAQRAPYPSADHVAFKALGSAPSAPTAGAQTAFESAKSSNVVYQRLDEGVVLDSDQEPVRRLRYRSADLVQWRNPATGVRCEISYPREDVLLVPIRAE